MTGLVLACELWLGTAPDLVDKTLVVWVAPAEQQKRGGSALTIDDGRDHFDGIVFGELAPQKWFAGSDYWRRSYKDQSRISEETADRNTFVQVAITYAGKEVSLYRNGVLLEHHRIESEPQAFGHSSRINIGLRHPRAGDGAHFAGAIDDARVYSQALTIDQLNQLQPNKPSLIKPWAWWKFNDEAGKDQTGRFRFPVLKNQAKIANGALILDGVNGEFDTSTGVIVPMKIETPSRPKLVPANWLTFHLAHPGPDPAMPGDPNCAFYWKGRYHLHYIYNNADGFVFAHVSSTDMVHWKWHPTTLTPTKTGHGMFSGTGFFTKEGRPAIIYHGQGSGRNQVSVALDDNLEKWSKPAPLIAKILPGQDETKIANWDPDAWVDNGSYFALSGGTPGSGKPPTLFKSSDMKDWNYLGLFMTKEMPEVRADEDVSCPNFFKIGSKYMLLCISHTLGCRYYLGDWHSEQFTPDFHARMNWHGWDFFAPESVLTPDGRRVMWAWCNFRSPQTGIQALPRELSLPADGVLRIKPLRELEQLRTKGVIEDAVKVLDHAPLKVKSASGDAVELLAEFGTTNAREFGIEVHCDSDGKSGFPITYSPDDKALKLGAMMVPFELKPNERLSLRIFIDKTMIEVFANDRQAAVAHHEYQLGNLGVQVVSRDGDINLETLKSWKIRSIYSK
ncbi:MAG: LamG-like jellyroll fold domain-containing protein [Armatimonadota bacterium]